jgi:hypothetical protein
MLGGSTVFQTSVSKLAKTRFTLSGIEKITSGRIAQTFSRLKALLP